MSQAAGSAATLVETLANMPLYRDESRYAGRMIPFYKRAQITASDLASAFGGKGFGAFRDLDDLTLFADNLVPHVLRCAGVLIYDAALALRIDAAENIEAGSRPEVEIRAVAVHAVERLVARMRDAGLVGHRCGRGRPGLGVGEAGLEPGDLARCSLVGRQSPGKAIALGVKARRSGRQLGSAVDDLGPRLGLAAGAVHGLALTAIVHQLAFHDGVQSLHHGVVSGVLVLDLGPQGLELTLDLPDDRFNIAVPAHSECTEASGNFGDALAVSCLTVPFLSTGSDSRAIADSTRRGISFKAVSNNVGDQRPESSCERTCEPSNRAKRRDSRTNQLY